MLDMIDLCKKEFDEVASALKLMPKQLIHNDICLTNILANRQEGGHYYLSGIIDFNSLVCCEPIIELAIVAARVNLDPSNPLKNMMQTIKGFNSVRKLTQEEKRVLYPLIKVRLAFLCLLTWPEYSANNNH
jgi:Ser/Thr protein kinase RdoA (MazF antagonist)